jgi:ribosomal-protein-alanine acetyltransferase
MAALAEGFDAHDAAAADIAEVAALEAEVFRDAWPEHLYAQEVGQPQRFQRVVRVASGTLAAYLFACWQVDELHVLKVASRPCYEGCGLATLLLREARREVERHGGRGIVLEVRPSNRRACRLYRHLGYRIIGRRPGYYSDGEDALVMYLENHLPTPLRPHD